MIRPGKIDVLLLAMIPLMLAGCGYRAPMYKTVVTENPDRFTSVREDYRSLAALVASDTGMPPTDSNTLSVLSDARQRFSLLLEDLRNSRESVYLEQYRLSFDSLGTAVAEVLKEKARAGLDVRVIVDRGTTTKADRRALRGLADQRVQANLYYRPAWLHDCLIPSQGVHRDHRKIILIDGRIGHLGSRNLADPYLSWRDCDVRVSGPAVKDLGAVYMDTQRQVAPGLSPLRLTPEPVGDAVVDTVPGLRQFKGKTVQILSDSPRDKALPVRNCFEWSIGHAQHYFYLYNPYAPPPSSTVKALKQAAARGVDVRWIVPSVSDIKAAKWIVETLYRELLLAGVKIYEWQGSVLHAKQFICDDYLTAIGSANMDNLSFFLNLEVEALVYDEEFADSARERFLEDARVHCRRITLEEVRKWSLFRKLRDWFFRITVGGIT